MGRLTEYMFNPPPAEGVENEAAAFGSTIQPTFESSLLNFMENFQRDDDITESPAVCKLHVPSWLNVWCIIITLCILAVLVALGLIMRQVQIQKQRHTRTECYNCYPAAPEYFCEHFIDRNQIMVY
ncbi:uncharacterized protein [Musca autumnalis]|uniref:uncharacterized protein n=1 Tax=Musca autumnalis TaxID=221902 RepID=UPI003CED7A75